MAGYPGTPRFGTYQDQHVKKTDSNGESQVQLQTSNGTTPDEFSEVHFLYNPNLRGREMGTTLGQAPGEYYERVPRGYDAPANHDGFFGGDAHLMNVDERKVLNNYIESTRIVCADDFQRNWNSDERTA